jgi:hypothetical protein
MLLLAVRLLLSGPVDGLVPGTSDGAVTDVPPIFDVV